LRDACARIRAQRPDFDASVTLRTAQLPSDVSVDAPVVQWLEKAIEHEGLPVRIEGMSAWTDAALLNEAGIPTVCFGPGDIGLAHAAEEFVTEAEVDAATRVLGRVVRQWCSEADSE
jgi:acetylornithine deacetylase